MYRNWIQFCVIAVDSDGWCTDEFSDDPDEADEVKVSVNSFVVLNRPFSKMAAENSNRSKLKTYTRTRKNTFTLVNLQNFSISGVISAEKMCLENWKIYRHLYDWGYNTYTQSYKRL